MQTVDRNNPHTTLAGHAVAPSKRTLASVLHRTALDRWLMRLQGSLYEDGYIRAVNYHDTPASTAAEFERHLQFYQAHFSPVSLDDLTEFFATGAWRKSRPGLIVSFDDGLRSHYETARPLLERYGFTGWFFIPTGFVDAPAASQRAFAAQHRIKHNAPNDHDRIAMSWEEVRRLSERHVVGSHTKSHRRMTGAVPENALRDEIAGAKSEIEIRLQKNIEAFCWVGGEESAYSPRAARLVQNTGYRFAFMTCTAPIAPTTNPLQLHRTNIESSWPLDVVQFQLCGVMDVLYAGKRKRVNRITAP